MATEIVRDVWHLPGNGQHRPLPLLFPHHFQHKDYLLGGGLQPVALAPLGEVTEVLTVARLTTQALYACSCCFQSLISCHSRRRQTHCHCPDDSYAG